MDQPGRDERRRDLRDPIGNDVAGLAAAAQPDGERDRGIEVAARTWPPAKIITIREAPIAIGAKAPAPGEMTVPPTVKTRKNVPMNSTMYFFMGSGRDGCEWNAWRGACKAYCS